MCVVISGIFFYLAYSYYVDGHLTFALVSLAIALLFLGLMLNNIRKTIKKKRS